jgi:aminopeptidase N
VTNVDLYNRDFSILQRRNLGITPIPSHDFLVIDLRETKPVNDIFWLDIEYNGVLREDQEGFYRGSYVNDQDQTVWYATTQFEITEARHAFPCYDEPKIRVPIKLAISYKEPYHAVANMPVNSTAPDENFQGYVKTTFQPTPPMQTYLLAFLISDYNFKEAPANSTRIPQNIYGTPKAIEGGWADYPASVVGAVVRELERYIGFEFPLPKLDHAGLYFIKKKLHNFIFLLLYSSDYIQTWR